jgi:hypothetical protein
MMNDYIKSLLNQTLDAHTILNKLKDAPGDLEIIKKQVGRIEEVLKELCNKIKESNNSSDDYVKLSKSAKFYLENYDFYNVIEAYKLYDEDPPRIKNMRTLVIKALEEKKLIEKIQDMLKRQD